MMIFVQAVSLYNPQQRSPKFRRQRHLLCSQLQMSFSFRQQLLGSIFELSPFPFCTLLFPGLSYQLLTSHTETEVEIILRPTFCRQVCLGSRNRLGTHEKIFFFYLCIDSCVFVDMGVSLSDQVSGPQFAVAAGTRQRSLPQVRVARE